ncbi:hypothetical protein RF11_07843 [Thelohanellus kitauei]|uniref:Uncharacterized protein n=1 Tax=Thelohanellus kitauei TaxID=669202 RepID=A0A0C2NJM5_THEKT|nr:hypothetical protein RF11_07843 [Thelohanellus kitauei]
MNEDLYTKIRVLVNKRDARVDAYSQILVALVPALYAGAVKHGRIKEPKVLAWLLGKENVPKKEKFKFRGSKTLNDRYVQGASLVINSFVEDIWIPRIYGSFYARSVIFDPKLCIYYKSETSGDRYGMYHDICVLKFLEVSMNSDFLLEGEGVTVEIDKSNFGIRKRMGLWAIRRKTPEVPNRALPIWVPNRTCETSFSIIQIWIKPGIPHTLNLCATVISDGLASYLGLDQMGHLHLILRKHTPIQLSQIGSMQDPICLQREQENVYTEAILWNISVGSNSTKVPSTKALEVF